MEVSPRSEDQKSVCLRNALKIPAVDSKPSFLCPGFLLLSALGCDFSLSSGQLDLITDLLGTPPVAALHSACEGARAHILRGSHKPVSALWTGAVCAGHISPWK